MTFLFHKSQFVFCKAIEKQINFKQITRDLFNKIKRAALLTLFYYASWNMDKRRVKTLDMKDFTRSLCECSERKNKVGKPPASQVPIPTNEVGCLHSLRDPMYFSFSLKLMIKNTMY